MEKWKNLFQTGRITTFWIFAFSYQRECKNGLTGSINWIVFLHYAFILQIQYKQNIFKVFYFLIPKLTKEKYFKNMNLSSVIDKAYLGDIACLLPDHCNKVNPQFFGFPMHIKVKFPLYLKVY